MALGIKKLHLVDETPIQYLETLSKELGIELYIKRDDLTPYGAGGNKLRKLEYLAQEALDQIADKGYAKPYAADSRKVIALGINFSSEKGTIDGFIPEVLTANT